MKVFKLGPLLREKLVKPLPACFKNPFKDTSNWISVVETKNNSLGDTNPRSSFPLFLSTQECLVGRVASDHFKNRIAVYRDTASGRFSLGDGLYLRFLKFEDIMAWVDEEPWGD